MFKKLLYGLIVCAGLVSCTEDYTDWLSPQSNEAHAAADALVLAIQPTTADVKIADMSEESIQLFTANKEVISDYELTLSGNGNTATIAADKEGHVSVTNLNEAVISLYGAGAVAREVSMTAKAKCVVPTEDGNVVAIKSSSPANIKVTPVLLVRPAAADAAEHPIIYMTGANYGWGSTWVPLHTIHGSSNTAWLMVYFEAGEEFKFSPVPEWSGDFSPVVGTDYANSGITTPNNCQAGTAGWYVIKVNKDTKTIDIYEPKVYLIGDCSKTGWSVGDEGLFSIPETKTGKFVSPVFEKNASVRMCVSIGEDWWRTEFVGLDYDGTKWITYRADGDDQTRYDVTAGQRAYISFTDGYCQYK